MNQKIDLNAPAFGPGSQKVEVASVEETTIEPEVNVEPEVKEEVVVPPVEENKVPYSRFKNVHLAKTEAENKLRQVEAELEELKNRPVIREVQDSEEVPDYWKELYGESDASKKAWDIQRQREEVIEQRAEERALKAVGEREAKEEARTTENLKTIESKIEDLSLFVGRDLTEKEQSEVLDIADEFTPKDAQGNYLGEILPFDKAWEIYEMKQEVLQAPKRKSRDNVATLTGSSSQGETTIDAEADKNWNPSWGALAQTIKQKLGQ